MTKRVERTRNLGTETESEHTGENKKCFMTPLQILEASFKVFRASQNSRIKERIRDKCGNMNVKSANVGSSARRFRSITKCLVERLHAMKTQQRFLKDSSVKM
jgi:hypothetical protein